MSFICPTISWVVAIEEWSASFCFAMLWDGAECKSFESWSRLENLWSQFSKYWISVHYMGWKYNPAYKASVSFYIQVYRYSNKFLAYKATYFQFKVKFCIVTYVLHLRKERNFPYFKKKSLRLGVDIFPLYIDTDGCFMDRLVSYNVLGSYNEKLTQYKHIFILYNEFWLHKRKLAVVIK